MFVNKKNTALLIFLSLFLVGCTQNETTVSLPEPTTIASIVPPTNTASTKTALTELKIGKADNAFQKPFTLKYPPEWKYSVSKDYDDPENFFQLEKADHKLSISNLPRGGGACLFDSEPDFDGPHADYRGLEYTENTYNFGTVRSVRRDSFTDKQRDIIKFCGKNDRGLYATNTSIGDIVFDIPKQSNQGIIREMYRILEYITLD